MKNKIFLDELYRQTDGNIEIQISMYDIGADIGLEKGESGAIAQDLIIEGFVNLRTLAGSISITPDGLKSLGIIVTNSTTNADIPTLGNEKVMDDNGRSIVTNLLDEIKEYTSSLKANYSALEEIVIDIKTIELHMMSPQPKPAVIRELLKSLLAIFSSKNNNPMAEKIALIIQDKD